MGRSGVLTVEMGRVMGVCITPEATQAHDKDRPFLDLQECRLNICLPPVCSGGARLLPPLSCCLHWVSSISLGCFCEHIWHLKYSHYDRCSFHPSSPGLSSIKLAICKSPLFNVYHTLNFIFIFFFLSLFFSRLADSPLTSYYYNTGWQCAHQKEIQTNEYVLQNSDTKYELGRYLPKKNVVIQYCSEVTVTNAPFCRAFYNDQ